MGRFRKGRFKSVSFGRELTVNRRGKVVRGSSLSTPVNSKRKTASTLFPHVDDYDREELIRVLGPDMDVDRFLNVARGKGKRRRRRKRKTISYRQKTKALTESWIEHRRQILSTYIAYQVLPSGSVCAECLAIATHRCIDCGASVYLCDLHVQEIHQEKLHVPEVWKDGYFQSASIKRTSWTRKDGHFETCDSQKSKDVVLIDSHGRHHKVPVLFCGHEKPGVTLTRHRMWPSTIIRTEVGFEFSLMDWMEKMYLECHVPCRNLCQALQLMGDQSPQLVKNMHQLLTKRAFAEYRLFKQQLRDLSFACSDLSKDDECPACPKEIGTRVISLDAIFGLKRWKKAKGGSDDIPSHGERMFLNQRDVDNYTLNYKTKGKISSELSECNSFQAGDKLRSKIKSSKVDETGVFGAVCRHEVPWKFFSLKQGESYTNAVYIIELLLKDIEGSPRCNLLIMYDIACLLTRHLQKSDGKRHLLDKIRMAVPAFHIYGHKPSCQVAYSPRRLGGFGLSDGEQAERVWSFLRNFAKTTREMTPANRVDALTEALLHYARNSVGKIGETLVQRFDRAQKTKTVAEKELTDALTNNKGAQFIRKEQIQTWAEQEKESLNHKQGESSKLTKEEKYVETLSKFYGTRHELVSYHGDDADHTHYLSQQVKQ